MSFGWAAALATIAVLLAYQLVLALAERRRPQRLARSVHASLREDWFAAIRAQKGAELLGVQTLRNALMSASMTASTAALGLMGTVTLAAPSLHASFSEGAVAVGAFTPRVALELVLVGLLFASLVSSVMAVRYYNHASFIVALPAESEVGAQWAGPGAAYVSKAGRLYSWSLRHLMLVVPILASILHPGAGPLAALLVVAVLSGFDRFSPEAAQA
jgi:hypothetical protein